MCLLSFSIRPSIFVCECQLYHISLGIKWKVKWSFNASKIRRYIKQFIRWRIKTNHIWCWMLSFCLLPLPHTFFRLRVKQKYGSEFEIKRKTDSWIMWPERNVDVGSGERERVRERRREQQQTAELANWIATLWQDIHFHTFKKWRLATCKFQDWASNDMIFSLLSCCVCVCVSFFLEHRISESHLALEHLHILRGK